MYRRSTPVVDARYEGGDGHTPVQAIVDALAEAEGVDPTAIRSLSDVVDTDALDRLLARTDGGSTVFEFEFGDWVVFVRGDGRIRVCDADEPTDPKPVFGSDPR